MKNQSSHLLASTMKVLASTIPSLNMQAKENSRVILLTKYLMLTSLSNTGRSTGLELTALTFWALLGL